jgi:penicillin-binding protein 2
LVEYIQELLAKLFSSRLKVLQVLLVFLACILVLRLFVLQIIRGADYQENYNLRIEKKRNHRCHQR